MPTVLPSDRHMGFNSAESLGRLLTLLLWKFWRICGAAILILILIYWMYGGVIILILLVVTIVGGLYHYQDSLLYYPEQPESARVFVQTPSSLGLPYENVYLTTKDNCRTVADEKEGKSGEGQLLIAMIVAFVKHGAEKPVWGIPLSPSKVMDCLFMVL